MKTVGDILKQARESHQISLEDIARYTKINRSYLIAIEANDFSKLPPSAFTKGFMQNYAKAVGLDPKVVLAIFRRDYDQDEKGRIIPRAIVAPPKSPVFSLNPSLLTLILSTTASVAIGAFFLHQIIIFTSPPQITLSQPVEASRLTSPILVQGQTQADATVTVNNQPVTLNADGSFSTQLQLTPGEHTLVVTAASRSHRQRQLYRSITVIPQP